MRDPNSTARLSLRAERGALAGVAEGSFHAPSMAWKGERLEPGEQQQAGEGEEASTWAEARGIGRRTCMHKHLG